MKPEIQTFLQRSFGLSLIGEAVWISRLRIVHPLLYAYLDKIVSEEGLRAPVTEEDSPEGHWQNWHHFGPRVWSDLLTAYCSRERLPLIKPFEQQGLAYASDGRQAVRLPAGIAALVSRVEGSPAVGEFFRPIPREANWRPLTDLKGDASSTVQECPVCFGHGWCTLKIGSWAPGTMCSNCEGEGTVKHRGYWAVPGSNAWMLPTSIEQLSFLPDPEWTFLPDDRLLAGRFLGGRGGFVTFSCLREEDYLEYL